MKKMYTKLKILPIYFVLFSLCILGVYDSANAQGHTVNGTVTSSNDGEALPGVNIMVEGSDTGTSTNIDGEYSLDVGHDDVTLLFSYIGYSTVEEPVNGRSTIDVALVMDAFEGDELVVVGYGTQRRRDVTGSVSSANVGEMQSIAVPRVSQALQGQVAGVQVVNTQKEPGGTVSMRIRGQNSINGNNNPLVVIDGIIGGNLNMVNTEDIETLDVLKDASATAIYGSRGANGVVVITTKRGFEGTPQINFGTSVGLQQVSKKLDLLDANGQREMLLGLPEDLRNTINVDGLLANVDPAVNTDWQDEVFEIAPMRDHNLSITGGTDQTRYAIMGSNSDQGGVVRGSGFGRTSLRVNLDQDVFEWLKVGVNLNLARTIQDNLRLNTAGGSSGGGVTDAALRMSPMVPVYNEDGSYGSSLGASPLSNPVALTNERPSQNKNNYLQGAFTTRIDLTDNLIFRTNSAYTNTDQLAQTFASGVLQEALGQGQATVSNITQQNWLIENTIEYRNTFSDDHDLTLLGGFTAEGTERFNSSSVGLGFSTEVNNFNSLQQAENQTVSSGFRDENLASFLGRINYSYMDKYLLTLSFRADGSSKFAAENKWASFPSAALSWRISEEDFLRESNFISDLRVRASYGITGSQAINPYQSLASLSTIANAYTFGDDIDAVGVGAGRVPNPSLKWETTEQANIGLELGLFESRINLTADVYDKTTKDLLFSRQLPWYSGYSSQTDNIGSMRNRGVELGLNTINTTGNFMWTTSANLSLNRNEILDLGPDGLDVFENAIGNLGSGWSQEHILREGEPMGSFYGYIFDGIYQNQEEVNAIEHTGASAGSVKLKDLNDDDRITEEDRTIIGDPNPDFIYSLTNEFSYRGFDLNIMVQGSYGNDILNIQKKRLDLIDDEYTDQNLLTSSNDYWRGEGTSNTLQAPGTGRGVVESRYVEDGSYLRLKNVLLGYNLPSNLVNKMGLQSLRVYGSAVNLLTFTNYSGYDPEVNMRGNENTRMGVDFSAFPSYRTFTIGVNVGL